jgi:Flp pilus assembly pilin Flp
MFRITCLATSLLLASGSALAHDGHGATMVHLHWWEYGLIAAAVAAVVGYLVRK